MKYFTSDTHFNHYGLLKTFSGGQESGIREFKNVKEMNETMIYHWNSKVKNGDLVYHLGDFAFPPKVDGTPVNEILDKLNGQIYLIKGNHDDKFDNIKLFENHPKIIKIVDLAYMKLSNKQRVMLCHYPMCSWRASCHGSWHLYGHCHGSFNHPSIYAIDVCVETNDYFPYSEIEIINIFKHRTEK